MGAYYTKEDITEYIGKNCILPFLFDSVKKTTSEKDFKEKGYIWQTLQQSGDKYIYDAVKHGYTADWLSLIPGEIAEGVDTTQPQLLERRSHWNERTPEPFNLLRRYGEKPSSDSSVAMICCRRLLLARFTKSTISSPIISISVSLHTIYCYIQKTISW